MAAGSQLTRTTARKAKSKADPLEGVEITQRGPVTTVRFDVVAGWEQRILLQSDNHHDSWYCNQELEQRHLNKAKACGAWIIQTGDYNDAMQGRFDNRRSYDDLRPELKGEDYYDRVLKYNSEFLMPYARNILVMADGNHEAAVLKYANTNLPDRLVDRLNATTGSRIVHGGYGGWVRFLFESNGVPQGSVLLKYYHGSGGEAPVTRGVIQTNRQAVYLPDAQIVVNGHSHNQYHVAIARERISGKGEMYMDLQHYVRVPGYNQSYGDGSRGWEVMRGGVPKPIGCAWIRLGYRTTHAGHAMDIAIESEVEGATVGQAPEGYYDGPVYAQDVEGA